MRDFNESQPYVMHLQAEHRRLHKMLTEARRTIEAPSEMTPERLIQQVIPTLQRVRDELGRHFAQEEQGGCLEEAVSHCPGLSSAVRHIEEEHPQLLARIDRLIAQAKDCHTSIEDRIALQNMYTELCRDLHAHEAAENELLTRGLGTNANGEESLLETEGRRGGVRE